jgi:hypothetical protein
MSLLCVGRVFNPSGLVRGNLNFVSRLLQALLVSPMDKHNECVIRRYTHKELTVLYKVSWKTLQRWLKPFEGNIGRKHGHFYSSRQVAIIFEMLGPPEGLAGIV